MLAGLAITALSELQAALGNVILVGVCRLGRRPTLRSGQPEQIIDFYSSSIESERAWPLVDPRSCSPFPGIECTASANYQRGGTQNGNSDIYAILAETANRYWLREYVFCFDASRRAENLQIP